MRVHEHGCSRRSPGWPRTAGVLRTKDPADLDPVLRNHRGKRVLVVVAGIYSMDGDMARLPELLDMAEDHGAPVFIDEAHSMLCYGATGGVVEHFGAQRRI